MAQRWSRQDAVHHHDDLTSAPRVVDRYDSSHLPRDGPLEASWHGPGVRRAFAAAAAVFVVAGIGMLGFFAVSDLVGSSGPSSSPSDAASQAGDGGPSPSPDGSQVPDLGQVLSNATSSTGPAP